MQEVAEQQEVLLSKLEDGVLWLTLNRPDRLNALDQALMRRLREATEEAAFDPAVRVVMLGGAGRGFCAGGDVQSGRKTDVGDKIAAHAAEFELGSLPELRADLLRRQVRTTQFLRDMPKPTVAVLRGPVAGAGLGLALACDFRVVSRDASFITSYARIGASGDYGVSFQLTRLLGPARAMELMILSERVDAEAAERLGLVTRLAEPEALQTAAEEFALRLAAGAPLAHRYIKRNIRIAEEEDLSRLLDVESAHMARAMASEDFREGARAMMEKRSPVWKGR